MVDYVHSNIVTSKMIGSQVVLLALGFATVGKSISCVKNLKFVEETTIRKNIIAVLTFFLPLIHLGVG
jgi:hypothetical protein